MLSVFQIVTLATTGNPWGVSGVLANWGAWIFEFLGGSVDKWYYFSSEGAQAVLERGFLKDPGTMRNLGIIAGALFSTLIASGFKFKKIKNGKQVLAAILGGLLMGYGARIGFGCNIGAPLLRYCFLLRFRLGLRLLSFFWERLSAASSLVKFFM